MFNVGELAIVQSGNYPHGCPVSLTLHKAIGATKSDFNLTPSEIDNQLVEIVVAHDWTPVVYILAFNVYRQMHALKLVKVSKDV